MSSYRAESVASILDAIASGRVVTVRVTIPEGLTALQIADISTSADLLTGKSSLLWLTILRTT